MPASIPVATERDWIARMRAGDTHAFEAVFRTYYTELCDVAFRYTRARETAEEVVQEVFAALWQSRGQLFIRETLARYLMTAVRNKAISAVRKEIVRRRGADTARAEQEAWHGRPLLDAESALEHQELVARIQATLDTLPDRCREVLLLRWQRQMSYAEIAEVMGISVKTVEIHMTRGLRALREAYPAWGD